MDNLFGVFSQPLLSVLILLWVSIWKAIALWKAAGKRQLVWFIILLVVNTLGILEILYLFWLNRYPLDKDNRILRFLDQKVGKKIKTP